MPHVGPMHIAPGALDAVDTSAELAIGTEALDGDGNRYKYLSGVASTAIGSVIVFDEAGVTALAVADDKGPIGVAQAATVANTFGWYLVEGEGDALTANDVADDGDVYLTATPGSVDDAVVVGDRVKGALFRAARTGAGLVSVQLFGGSFVDDIAD